MREQSIGTVKPWPCISAPALFDPKVGRQLTVFPENDRKPLCESETDTPDVSRVMDVGILPLLLAFVLIVSFKIVEALN